MNVTHVHGDSNYHRLERVLIDNVKTNNLQTDITNEELVNGGITFLIENEYKALSDLEDGSNEVNEGLHTDQIEEFFFKAMGVWR